jgi:hypothetical protein
MTVLQLWIWGGKVNGLSLDMFLGISAAAA